jgi:glycosyltransferase involved in cell wall biosynthesis
LRVEPDLIHFQWNSAAIDALSIASVWERPVIISCRGTQVRIRPHVNAGFADGLRESFRRATAVHCVCDAIRNEAVSLGLDIAKSEVILPAVDIAEFAPRAERRRNERFRLLSVGALIWTKGPEYSLLALRTLLDSGVQAELEIIGSGNEMQRLLFTIHDLGLQDSVTVSGRVGPAAVRTAMQCCDAFLHTSLSEGISNAVLEAMACGVPPVTSDCGGMREAVTSGHDGFVVPVRDPIAAAAALRTLATDSELRARMGRDARRTVEERFRLDEQGARFTALYERVGASRVTA